MLNLYVYFLHIYYNFTFYLLQHLYLIEILLLLLLFNQLYTCKKTDKKTI